MTVTVTDRLHPVPKEYVIIAVPGPPQLTTPDVASIEATDGKLLLHVPPPERQLKVVLPPAHAESVPDITVGKGLTVTGFVVEQPVGSVYVMVAVPAPTPFSVPVDETVAMPPTEGLHVPPPPSESGVVAFTHTELAPDIEAGNGLTVTAAVALQPAPIE